MLNKQVRKQNLFPECLEYTFSDVEKVRIVELAREFEDYDFYSNSACADKYFVERFRSIASTELIETLFSMASGLGPEVLVLHDYPVDSPLPLSRDIEWNVAKKGRNSEIILCGVASLMKAGLQREESSHQNGYVQQVYPVRGYEIESSGRGNAPLAFHVENVFIKTAPSFLGLACLAGQSGVQTEYLPVSDVVDHLDETVLEELHKPIYDICSGDGFTSKTLQNTAVFDDLPNGWILSRIYEEDRIHAKSVVGREAVSELKKALSKAKDDCVRGVELKAGTLLFFSNGLGKGRYGGVLHGRKGKIAAVEDKNRTHSQRWLQRVCVEILYD